MSWNVGGVALNREIDTDTICELECNTGRETIDVVTIQELPREPHGWHFAEVQGWHFHSHKEEGSCKGAGGSPFGPVRQVDPDAQARQ